MILLQKGSSESHREKAPVLTDRRALSTSAPPSPPPCGPSAASLRILQPWARIRASVALVTPTPRIATRSAEVLESMSDWPRVRMPRSWSSISSAAYATSDRATAAPPPDGCPKMRGATPCCCCSLLLLTGNVLFDSTRAPPSEGGASCASTGSAALAARKIFRSFISLTHFEVGKVETDHDVGCALLNFWPRNPGTVRGSLTDQHGAS